MTEEVVTLLKSYATYERQFFAETYAKTFFCGEFRELSGEECQEKIDFIKSLIDGLAPSNMATLLNLHYINKISIDKCAECMAISRSSAYRLLKRAHVALNNRYKRMKGGE